MTRVEGWALATAALLAAFLPWPIRDYITDDTFIHLQHARNLAAGHGLVFNPGEAVYGFTSPLWAGLLAVGMILGWEGLGWARVLGTLSTLASVGLFFALMRRTVPTTGVRAAATVAWASHAWMARWSLSGMETSLAVALVLAGFVTLAGEPRGARAAWTGAWWSLAALARPEAALLIVLWGLWLLAGSGRRGGLARLGWGALPPIALYGAWLLFARLAYGTLWPHTLDAKVAGSAMWEFHLENAWRQMRIVGATDAVLAATLPLALLLGRGRSAASGRAAWLAWAWVAGLPLLYAARGVPVLSRYLLVILPVLAWLTWRAAERWWTGGGEGAERGKRASRLAWTVAALVVAQNLTVFAVVVVPQVRTFTPALRESLVRWGLWFREHAPKDAMIATPDIGAIGYFSERRVVDLAGLVTPEMVPYLERESWEEATAAFRFAAFSRPEFLVDRGPEAYSLLGRSPFAACLVPLGAARVPSLGLARPEATTYSFYRVDWAVYDSARAGSRAESRAPE